MRALDAARATPGRLVPDVITSLAADRDRLTEQFQRDRRTIALGLCEVAALLDRTTADEAAIFKRMLISTIGEGVARARGRFGREMSETDEKTLDLIAQFLF